MFIKCNMKRELNSIHLGEETWWNKRLIKTENDLRDRYQNFVENFNNLQIDEEFAYEGIFDQKPKIVNTSTLNQRKMDNSNLCGTMNRSRFVDDKYKIKLSSSNVMNIQDDISCQAPSPISDFTNQDVMRKSLNSPSNSDNPLKRKSIAKLYSNFSNALFKSKSFVTKETMSSDEKANKNALK